MLTKVQRQLSYSLVLESTEHYLQFCADGKANLQRPPTNNEHTHKNCPDYWFQDFKSETNLVVEVVIYRNYVSELPVNICPEDTKGVPRDNLSWCAGFSNRRMCNHRGFGWLDLFLYKSPISSCC